jgi:3-deoxy-D-manno-octulosonic-acid transferase
MRVRERLALWCYLWAVNVLLPAGIVLGLPLLCLREKRRKTIFKRLGFQTLPQVQAGKRPLWIHSLSLGETLSAVSLVQELRRRLGDQPMVFSVSTLSAMQMAEERIRPFVDDLFYFPLDLWWVVRRTLRIVSPRLIVFIETDIWPGFQRQVHREQLPALLVNARLSPDSYRAGLSFKSLFAPALNSFERIYPQSEAEAERYLQLGVAETRLGHRGNLKFDVARRAPSEEELERLRSRLGTTRSDIILLAGSTHSGEEEIVLAAYERVRKQIPSARLIVVPRHPARAAQVAALVSVSQARTRLLSQGVEAERWDVLVVDEMGLLSRLYHLGSASYVGGSLVPKGGQNPLEAAAAGCPVLFGRDMTDFPDISRGLLEAGAALQIASAEELANGWTTLLMNGPTTSRMKQGAREFVEQHSGSTGIIAEQIMSMLELEKEKSYCNPEPEHL